MIMGHECTITYRKKLKGNLEGYFQSDPLQIFVKSCPNWVSILNHEIIHAILWLSGHSQKMDEKDEEALVMALESGYKSLLIMD